MLKTPKVRKTKRVSTFPIYLVDKGRLEAPLVRDGKIVDYYGWRVDERAFPLDMAAFAVNIGYFVQQSGHNTIGFPSIKGFQETGFLSMLNMSSFRDVEPLAPKGVSNRVRTNKTA